MPNLGVNHNAQLSRMVRMAITSFYYHHVGRLGSNNDENDAGEGYGVYVPMHDGEVQR